MSKDDRQLSGTAPYWATGTQILWRSGDGPLGVEPTSSLSDGSKVPNFAEPVTVVRDDADALVAWLASGTQVRRVARADGLAKRDAKSALFTADVRQEIATLADREATELMVGGGLLCRILEFHQQYLAKNPFGYFPIHATGVKYADA